MDSTVFSNKTYGRNMMVTRLAAKEGACVSVIKGRPRKRKRRSEKETSATETNGSEDQMGDRETEEEERSPNKIRKVSGEEEETDDSEEDMEVKEDEEDDDCDQDMTEGEDEVEEDSGCHVRHRQVKVSSGEPLAVDRSVFRTSVDMDSDIANCLRSRRSIHTQSQEKKDSSHGTTESLPGMGLRSRVHRTEALAPRARISHYREEIVLTKPNLASQNRSPPPQARVVIANRLYIRPKVYPSNNVLQRPPAKGQKQELVVKSIVETTSYTFFEGWCWKLLLLLLISAAAVLLYLFLGKRVAERESALHEGFQARFLDVVSSFPSQRAEVWKRSKIHLERHLQTAEPTEPVSMILTSGRGAERTLRCLAGRMAAAFSSALGASVLHIDGAGTATLESDRVKLDIDQQLSGAFEGDGRAAVVHRFEELPPGSTLIFYRYCDHENAAYKNVLLVFTVQLPTERLSPELPLNAVEEMVQERIQGKFLSASHAAAHDQMDTDKLSGLWSRISHLILPVVAEERIEQQDCGT